MTIHRARTSTLTSDFDLNIYGKHMHSNGCNFAYVFRLSLFIKIMQIYGLFSSFQTDYFAKHVNPLTEWQKVINNIDYRFGIYNDYSN